MKRLIRSVLILILLGAPVRFLAAAQNWDVITSMHTVRALIRVGGDLWGATNGGLFRFDLETETFQTFTNADGLSSNNIQAMVVDNRGNLILGMGNAYVDIFNLATYEVTRISDFKLDSKIFKVYALYHYLGDTVYVGTDIGVSRLVYFQNLDQYLIKNNYTSLGDFPPETGVSAIEIYDGDLWVGTSAGIARGDLSAPSLESPAYWSNLTTAQGLAADSVSALAVFQDTLYAATPEASSYGLNRLVGDSFETLQVSYSEKINFLKASPDTLYLGRYNGIYRLESDQICRYGPTDASGLCLEFGEDSTLWAGMEFKTKLGGLKHWNDEQWTYYAPEGPQAEVIMGISVEDDGSLWVVGKMNIKSFSNGSLCHFDGDHWVNLSRLNDNYVNNEFVSPDSFFWYEIRAITEDNSGSIWVASEGRGVGWFEFVNDTIRAKDYFSSNTGELTNIVGSSHYCQVKDLLTDNAGNIWICNSRADPAKGESIAIVPSAFIQDTALSPDWYYHTVMNDDETAVIPKAQYYMDRIAQDSFGRKWFGPNNNWGAGIHILDDNGTIEDSTDDDWTTISDLPSDSITAIACDRDGVVWVGTPAGVQFFYPEEDAERLYGIDLYDIPVGSNISTITVDPQNNKWFGTGSGVCVLASDNYTWLDDYTFTSIDGDYPSPLPGDVVQAITFDPGTGDAYLGTDKGLARLSTPYKQTGPTVSYISIVKPNPFVIQEGEEARLYLDAGGLSETAELKIFTVSGLLVRHLNGTEIVSGWNGRNSLGELVGSGVYLLLAYSPDGNTAVGKVAVIHK